MILNDLESDVKSLFKKRKKTQKEVGEEMGEDFRYLNRVLRKGNRNISDFFVRAIEVLGYDIRIEFIRRRGKSDN